MVQRIADGDLPGYCSEARFHQTFIDPKTGSTVSYADCGAPDGRPLLFMLPGGNTRLFSILLDAPCRQRNIRLVAFDRPGSGQTSPCEATERIQLSTDICVSLLAHLNMTNIQILAHSVGFVYSVQLLLSHPNLFTNPPRIFCFSPWVPLEKGDGIHPLALIPAPLVANQHLIVPFLMLAINLFNVAYGGCQASFGWSGSLFSSTAQSDAEESKENPYYSKDKLIKLVMKKWLSEPRQGNSAEYMLCLGKGSSMDLQGSSAAWYEQAIGEISARGARQGDKPVITVRWAEKDGIVSLSRRDWLDNQLGNADGILFSQKTLPKVGHDDAIFDTGPDGIFQCLDQIMGSRERCI